MATMTNTAITSQLPAVYGRMVFELRDAKTGKLKERIRVDNITCQDGKNARASVLADEGLFTGAINYMAIGTGSNGPLDTDTQLQAEVARTTVASSSRTNNIITLSFFYGSGVANTTLREAGAYIDGGVGANSGELFDRVNINIVKTIADTLTISLIVTVN
jgi:hypothetical protein